ncbi:hypothetical protein IAU60_002276 [Kwoniella sp. DSM 27419]
MPRARLPPLPAPATWSTHFPTKFLPLSPDRNLIRKAPGRILLANPALCDSFVRAMKLRPGEVIIESWAGPGALTRSLISGGNSVEEARRWVPPTSESAELKGQVEAGAAKKRKVKSKATTTFPRWIEDLPAALPETKQPEENTTLVKPRLVVSAENSLEILTRGLDYPAESGVVASTESVSDDPQRQTTTIQQIYESGAYNRPVPIVRSTHAPNLLLSHSTSYVWPTLPRTLSDPMVAEHLPVHDPTQPPGPETTKRPWDADEPPITVVATLPDSSIGEQLAAQWIGSVVGDEGQERTWIWQWGRLRIAFLCGKSLYDRILAKPGDIIHCKLSILAQALFDIVPLPPYHHVTNVDKQSKITYDRPHAKRAVVGKSTARARGIPKNPPSSAALLTQPGLQKTITYPLDFYPRPTTVKANLGVALDRPELLGLMLVPKKRSPILARQKDIWDYVMRRLFVRDTLTIKEAIPNLAFGAETLLLRIAEEEPDHVEKPKWRGVPVDPGRVVRDLEVDEWLRIVDVFDQWAFKPENLILDSGGPDENIREFGQD